jgi:hypothetical protein
MTELPRAERCDGCRYWGFQGSNNTSSDKTGLCRRNPPVLDPGGHKEPVLEVWVQGMWPATYSDEWCGEWRPRDGAKAPAKRTQNHEWMSEFFNYHKGHLRIWNIIERTGVTSREELAAFGRAKLWEVNGCGATTIAIIADYLKSHGLTLAE